MYIVLTGTRNEKVGVGGRREAEEKMMIKGKHELSLRKRRKIHFELFALYGKQNSAI